MSAFRTLSLLLWSLSACTCLMPKIKWAQDNNFLYITVSASGAGFATGITNENVTLTHDTLVMHYTGMRKQLYDLEMKFREDVIPDESRWQHDPAGMSFTLKKKFAVLFDRLVQDPKPLQGFLKLDLNRLESLGIDDRKTEDENSVSVVSPLTTVTTDSLPGTLSDSGMMLLLPVHPWCQDQQKTQEVLVKVQAKLNLTVGVANALESREIGRKYLDGCVKRPTVLVLTQRQHYSFVAPSSQLYEDDLVRFVQAFFEGEFLPVVESKSAWAQFLSKTPNTGGSHNVGTVLVYSDSTDSEQFTALHGIATDMRTEARLAVTNDLALYEEVVEGKTGTKGQLQVTVVKQFRYERMQQSLVWTEGAAMRSFLKLHCSPIIETYSTSRTSNLKQQGRPTLQVYLDTAVSEQNKHKAVPAQLVRIAEQYTEKLAVVVLHYQSYGKEAKACGLLLSEKDSLPAYCFDNLQDEKGKFGLELGADQTLEGLTAFVEGGLKGSLSALVLSQKVPEEQGKITTVVGKTFKSLVSGSKKIVLIELYDSSMGLANHNHSIEQLELLVEALPEKALKSLVVASTDVASNHLPQGPWVYDSFAKPRLVLITPKKKQTGKLPRSVGFKGAADRPTAKELARWLHKKGAIKGDLQQILHTITKIDELKNPPPPPPPTDDTNSSNSSETGTKETPEVADVVETEEPTPASEKKEEL